MPSSTINPDVSPVSRRNVGLDLLRLVAVILVLFNHATFSSELFPAPLSIFIEALRRGGWVGVDLFFVLSGFLVSDLLYSDHQRNGRASIRSFLIRRALKIYPAFWVLLAYTCVSIARREAEFSSKSFLGELFFLQNYVGHFWGHTWSLAVEEHFYLTLALLVIFLQRRNTTEPFGLVPRIFFGVALLCFLLRLFEARDKRAFDWLQHLTPTHLRVDSLFFGVLLAYGVRYHALLDRLRRIPRALFIIVGVALFLPAFLFDRSAHRWLTVGGYNLFYLGGGMLVVAVTGWYYSPRKLVRGLAALGAASYSIYLWHAPVGVWTARLTRHESIQQEILYLATYVVGALLAGFVASRLVEMPVLRIRDRYFRSRSGPLARVITPPRSAAPAIAKL